VGDELSGPADEMFAEEEQAAVNMAGEVREITTGDWPQGYILGATRYADVILAQSFPDRFRDLVRALSDFRPTLSELRTGGGGRTAFVRRFDESLAAMKEGSSRIWGKQNITIEKSVGLDGTALRTSRTRGHEIDMFGKGTIENPLPGIAVEMEWNNKDPFFDRDLINFQALHREGAIAIGVIVTRGPSLQTLIGPTIRSKDSGLKYGQSTTHWDKLIPKVNLGGGGECPLLLIGIEPDRIAGIELVHRVRQRLDAAAHLKAHWRETYRTRAEAEPEIRQLERDARDLMPPIADRRSNPVDGG